MGLFDRTKELIGDIAMGRLNDVRVIVFGVGGVGSWCTECLVRTGIGHLTIVDCDMVDENNVNRQLMATVSTIGKFKVDVLRERLLDINPQADITALHERYSIETSSSFALAGYDYVVDCIDSLDDKMHLILETTKRSAAGQVVCSSPRLFSSMGAARKIDPTRIRSAEFWKVSGCALARALRNRMKREGLLPQAKFMCVYSDETPYVPQSQLTGSQGKGSLMQVTAAFGLTLASLVVNDLLKNGQ